MDLKSKLALRSTVVSAITMGVVAGATLLSFTRYSASQYYALLEERALITGIIFLEKDELSKQRYAEYEELYGRPLDDEQMQIYGLDDSLAFVAPIAGFPGGPGLLGTIRDAGSHRFSVEERQYVGLFYRDNQGDFVIITSGVNAAGREQTRQLALLLGVFLLMGLAINYLLNIRVAQRAFRPFADILSRVNTISTRNLSERLPHASEARDELRELVDTLNMFLERLDLEVTRQRMFLKNVSHELNTPLTAIIGRAEVSLDKGDPEGLRQALEQIVEDTTGLKSLIESLLLISGLDSQRERPTATVFRIDELLWEVLDKLAYKYPGVVFNTSIEVRSEEQHLLETDNFRELVGTALLNLIDNAIKFSSATSATITLTQDQGRAVVIVRDDGPGIPDADREKIFDLFFRGPSVRHIPGHGVGLSLTRQIMELAGIRLEIDSDARGTEVRVRF